MRKSITSAKALIVFLSSAATPLLPANENSFQSPYDGIDWETHRLHLFDGHVHTRGNTVEEMVAAYHNMGYAAIAFADARLHYPMEDYLEDPEKYDITVLPGQGNRHYSAEAPYSQHHKVWFSEVDYDHTELAFAEAIARVGEDGGLLEFAHPASHIYPMYSDAVGAEWYIEYFDGYDHVIGIEINNHDGPRSLRLFDDLLMHYGPERLVVGFGVSDTQGLRDDGSIGSAGGDFGFSLLISEERDREGLREAIEAGRVLWVDMEEPDADTEELIFPRVTSIDVEPGKITLRVEEGYERIDWIYDHKVIHGGKTFTLEDTATPRQNYVRFEIHAADGATVGSQAFYITEIN